jgi:hypothetical protein
MLLAVKVSLYEYSLLAVIVTLLVVTLSVIVTKVTGFTLTP